MKIRPEVLEMKHAASQTSHFANNA